MKALWITSTYPSESAPFAGSFHRNTARALAQTGVDVSLVAPVPRVPAILSSWFPERFKKYTGIEPMLVDEGTAIHRPPYLTHPRQNLYGFPHIPIGRAIRKLDLDVPDVIHAHFAYPQGMVALRLSERWGIPSVLTLHGSDVNTFPHSNWLAMSRFEYVARNVSSVIAVSGALAEETERLTGVEPRVLPLGVPLDRFSDLPKKKDARRILGLSESAFIVLYVGAFTPRKGIQDLLEALSGPLPENVLGLFVGSGPLLPDIRDLPSAEVVGAVPNEDIPAYLAAADVLVLPSYGEGMPTVLVEAGAAGVPVIASSVGGIPGLLANDRGTIIPPGSPKTLRKALVSVILNWDEAMERAKRLQLHVRERYDIEKNAFLLRDLYEELT